jgi:hypothetical protein
MILPDGSRVISVGALPQAGAASAPAARLIPAQPIPFDAVNPVENAGQSVLEKTPPEPAPVPAEIEPADEADFEELPAGNASKAEDV